VSDQKPEDLYPLTDPDRFDVLDTQRTRLVVVRGGESWIEDRYALARKHVKLPIINEAAYGAAVIDYQVREALRLMNKGQRTDEEEEQLHRTTKVLKAVVTALRPLYARKAKTTGPRLAAPDTWSDDRKPSQLVDFWMSVLPQIKKQVRAAGHELPTTDRVRQVLETGTLHPQAWTAYGPPGQGQELLEVPKLLEKNDGVAPVVAYCHGKMAARDTAFATVATILGQSWTSAAVKKARERDLKRRPGK
jgi:hypothetical protein